MARPPKSGLEYFPLDVDMDSDEKVAYVISRHGFHSFGLLVKLYMEIYRQGYYIVWNERQRYLLSHRLNIEPDYTENVVSACINEGIFNENLFSFYDVLTSRGIQSRYVQACGRRVGVRMAKELCLLEEAELKGTKIEFVPINLGINAVSVSNNPVFYDENHSKNGRNEEGKNTKTNITADNNGVSDNINDVFAEKTAKTEKEFPLQDFNNNCVSADINPSFGKKSENDRLSDFVSGDINGISDNKNGVSVNIMSTEIPQSKVNITTTTVTTTEQAAADDFSEVAKVYEDNIHSIVGEIDKDKLMDILQDFGKKWVLEAIKEAALSNVRNIKYIIAILERWKKQGFKAPKGQRKEATASGHNGRSTRSTQGKAPSKGDYSEYDEALRWQQQHRPWDVQSEQGSSGEESGIDTAI